MTTGFTHLDDNGKASMVDVTDKAVTKRRAVARCVVVSRLDLTNAIAVEDLVSAELAGQAAAKATPNLIPLCHPLPTDDVVVRIGVFGTRADIEAEVVATAKTGVEMEALTAAATTALSLVYVLDSRDPTSHVEDLAVWSKEGGKSGTWGRAI